MANIPMNNGGHAFGRDVNQNSSQNFTRPKSAGSSASTLANWAGALVSVGLIVGIGVWGYKLLVRDVSGVPVVSAIDGPMRVRAENPGGRIAENQGLSVNRVAADGGVTPTADRLVLAPRAAELSSSDLPASRLATISTTAQIPVVETDQPTEVEGETAIKPKISSIQALAAQLASGASSLGDTTENTYVAANNVQLAAVAVPAIIKPVASKPVLGGLGRSLRPHTRPASLRTENITPVKLATTRSTLDVDPASIPAGTRLVQLGAFESPEIAKSEWDRINARFSTYMDGKSRVIQRAKSGGRIFYRLRAMGFEDIAGARRFCSALAAERADCIPVVTR